MSGLARSPLDRFSGLVEYLVPAILSIKLIVISCSAMIISFSLVAMILSLAAISSEDLVVSRWLMIVSF